jgi:hypothetical protein
MMRWELDKGAARDSGPWRATATDGGRWALQRSGRKGHVLSFNGEVVSGPSDRTSGFARFSDAARTAESMNEARA